MSHLENTCSALSLEVKNRIEKEFYNNLNKSANWNKIFINSLRNNEDLILNIENYANNGISNLRKLFQLYSSKFEETYKLYAQDNQQDYLEIMKWYASLLCYFHNCYDHSHDKTLLELNEVERIEFFYGNEIEKILDMIISQHKAEVDKLIFLLEIKNTNDKSIKTILRELLSFPFILELSSASKNSNLFESGLLWGEINTRLTDTLGKYYSNIEKEAFSYLKMPNLTPFSLSIILTAEIIKLIKSIHFLNGSRKSYGYYQCAYEKRADNVFYSISYQSKMFFVHAQSALVAGQKNINDIEITGNGCILINFKAHLFDDESVMNQSAFNTALVINEFISYNKAYFTRIFSVNQKNSGFRDNFILLEQLYDDMQFSQLVKDQVNYLDKDNVDLITVIPPLKSTTINERSRYFSHNTYELSPSLKAKLANNIMKAFHKIDFILPDQAFENVSLIELLPGEILFKENDNPIFTYIPLDEGLQGYNIKDEITFYPLAWVPVGHISVIQREKRTATITATKKVKLLMIPGDIYRKYWHTYHTINDVRNILFAADPKGE